MPAAARAQDFRAEEQVAVAARHDSVWKRAPEARPAGAAVIFGGRAEQRQSARGAEERPLVVLIVKRAREGRLGPGLTQDMIALRPEDPLPFRGRVIDCELEVRAGAAGAAE